MHIQLINYYLHKNQHFTFNKNRYVGKFCKIGKVMINFMYKKLYGVRFRFKISYSQTFSTYFILDNFLKDDYQASFCTECNKL